MSIACSELRLPPRKRVYETVNLTYAGYSDLSFIDHFQEVLVTVSSRLAATLKSERRCPERCPLGYYHDF